MRFMNLNKGDISYLLINILLTIFLFFSINSQSYLVFTLIAIFLQLLLSFFYLKNKNFSFFSISGIFLFLTYIFHFGHVFINIFNNDYIFITSNYIRNDYLNATKAILLSYAVIPFIVFGLGIANFIDCKKFYKPINKRRYFIMAMIIIFLSFPIKLYIDINKIILFFEGGYSLAYSFRLNGILTQFASFYYVGFILLILVFKNNKSISNTLTLFLLCYQCLSMLTGNRGIQLINIVFTLLIYYKFIRRFTKYDFIFLVVTGYIGMSFISMMSVKRLEGFDSLASLIKNILSFNINPLYPILDEFGYTLHTIVLEFRNSFDFGFGKTYLYSLFTVFPNINDFLHYVTTNACFVTSLNYPHIGGTYIGELYYNFGIFAPLFGTAIGLVVGYVSKMLEKYINNNRLLEASCLILPSVSILWWVRNYFKDMPREFIWGILFFLSIYRFSCIIENYLINYFNFQKDNTLNKEKKVSFIMGVYNTEVSMLEEAVCSVLYQTYKNIELIIVNDCSTNSELLSYLSHLQEKENVILINNETNLGLTKSLNKAINYCTGEYIARMDTDDVCELDRVSYQVDIFNQNPDIDVLSGGIKQIGQMNQIIALSKNTEDLKASLFFRNDYIVHPTVIMRKNVIVESGGYDERFVKAQDYGLWCKLIQKYNFVVDSRVVLNYRIHDQQASIAASSLQKECANLIRSEYAKNLLVKNRDIELLNLLSLAQLQNIDDLNYITNKLIDQNILLNYVDRNKLISELCKYYCYQCLKIIFLNKDVTLIKKIKYKHFFFKKESLIFVFNYLKNIALSRKN